MGEQEELKEFKKFILLSPIYGDTIIDASSWEEVASLLYRSGYRGEARVIERTYHSVCDTPHIINIDLLKANNE